MIHTLTTAPRDMRTTGRSVQISNDLFNTQMIEPRILRIQPDPGPTIEQLTGMHVSAGEIDMEIPTQITPPAVIDRGHQATQQLNSNHTLRLLALIDTYRGPTRIQTSLVVPDQSDKPVPDQMSPTRAADPDPNQRQTVAKGTHAPLTDEGILVRGPVRTPPRAS